MQSLQGVSKKHMPILQNGGMWSFSKHHFIVPSEEIVTTVIYTCCCVDQTNNKMCGFGGKVMMQKNCTQYFHQFVMLYAYCPSCVHHVHEVSDSPLPLQTSLSCGEADLPLLCKDQCQCLLMRQLHLNREFEKQTDTSTSKGTICLYTPYQ